jgi:hypothetical protein
MQGDSMQRCSTQGDSMQGDSLQRGSLQRRIGRGLAVAALGLAATQCNTFDDPPEHGGDAPFEPFVPTPIAEVPAGSSELPQPVTPFPPTPPVVTSLPVPPTATTLPGAIDGGLPPEDPTTSTSGASNGETSSANVASRDASAPSLDAALGEPATSDAGFIEVGDASGADAGLTPTVNDTDALVDAGD